MKKRRGPSFGERQLVPVGIVGKPHGLRGEFCVGNFAGSPHLFDSLDSVFLRLGRERPGIFPVSSWRLHRERVLLTLRGIDGRDRAEGWRGAEILVRPDDLPRDTDDEIFLYELEGLEVRLPDGSRLGRIVSVMADPQEVWTIETEDGREVLFPATEEFIPEADPEDGWVMIDPPPGLLELYLGE